MLNRSSLQHPGTSLRRRERGITIAMLALFIVVLFIIAALAIDVGVLYTARTSAQHAADAAALAGAYTFLNPNATQKSAAQNAAIHIAAQNSILGQSVNIAPGDVNVDTVNRRVTVTVSRLAGSGVTTFFANVMGISAVDVQTKATAEASNKATGGYCIKPIYIPNTALSPNPVSKACPNEVIFDASGNLTAYAFANLGQPFTTRPIGGASKAIVPSQYGSLDFGSGAATYLCSIENCLNDCGISSATAACGNNLTVETGNMDGPTKTGFQTLIGNPPDQWQGIGEYVSAGVLQDTSKSLVAVAVWDNCNNSIGPGKTTVQVLGFATVFITGVDSSGVYGRFVYASGCSAAGGSPGGGTGPLAVPVRLVQTPTQ